MRVLQLYHGMEPIPLVATREPLWCFLLWLLGRSPPRGTPATHQSHILSTSVLSADCVRQPNGQARSRAVRSMCADGAGFAPVVELAQARPNPQRFPIGRKAVLSRTPRRVKTKVRLMIAPETSKGTPRWPGRRGAAAKLDTISRPTCLSRTLLTCPVYHVLGRG